MTLSAEGTLRARVARVRHREGAFAVVEVEVDGLPVVAVGEAPGLAGLRPGQSVALHGEWTWHPEHGEQFRVEDFEVAGPGDLVALDVDTGERVVRGLVRASDRRRDGAPAAPERIASLAPIYRERHTLVSGPIGEGKSELARAASAEVTAAGDVVVYLDLEQHPDDTLAALERTGADLSSVWLLDGSQCDLPAVLADAVEVLRPALVVLDSLAALLQRSGANEDKAHDVGPLVRALTDLAHRPGGAAVLTLHHARRGGDGGARGSGEVLAAPDVAVELVRDKTDPLVRHLRVVKARWPVEHCAVGMEGDRLRVLEPGEAPAAAGAQGLEARILAHLAAHPEGQSVRAIRSAVGVRAARVSAAIAGLEAAGRAARGEDGLVRMVAGGAGSPRAQAVVEAEDLEQEQAVVEPDDGADVETDEEPVAELVDRLESAGAALALVGGQVEVEPAGALDGRPGLKAALRDRGVEVAQPLATRGAGRAVVAVAAARGGREAAS